MIYYQLLVKSNIKTCFSRRILLIFNLTFSFWLNWILTHDVQPLGAGLHLTLDIKCLAGVVPGILFFNLLQNQTLIWNNLAVSRAWVDLQTLQEGLRKWLLAGCLTHVVPPRNFVGLGVSLDVTFKVDVVSLLQVSGVDSWAEIEFNMRRNWNYVS